MLALPGWWSLMPCMAVWMGCEREIAVDHTGLGSDPRSLLTAHWQTLPPRLAQSVQSRAMPTCLMRYCTIKWAKDVEGKVREEYTHETHS